MNSNNLVCNIASLLLNGFIIVEFNSLIIKVVIHSSEYTRASLLDRWDLMSKKYLDIDTVTEILKSPTSLNEYFYCKLYLYEEHFNQIRKQLDNIKIELNG